MSRAAESVGSGGAEGTAALRAPSPPLPDVNAETHPYSRVQAWLDEAVCFDLHARPRPAGREGEVTLTPEAPEDYFGIQGGYGLVVDSSLQRFETRWRPGPVPAAEHAAGGSGGSLRSRWLVSTDAMEWSPGTEPPPAIFDPWRSQPFAMLDCEIEIGDRGDGLVGYGVGRTFPVTVAGRPRLLAAAVGTLLDGHGRFRGMDATFALNGEITEGLGFRGNVTVRAPDPEGRLRTGREVPALLSDAALPDEDDGTYLVLRGEKESARVRTVYGEPPGAGRVTLVTPARMRAVAFPFTCAGRGGLRGRMVVGPEVARLQASVALDILAPAGTLQRPNDFTTRNVYTFLDARGEPVGTLEARVVLGKSFHLSFPGAPDQPAMRYGGFGPIVGATGRFEGVRGLVSLNSAIGVAPHALSMVNVVRLVDPLGRFRTGGGPAGGTP
jgi:hypothetical protein